MSVSYTPKKDDLFYPAKSLNFFPNVLPSSKAELCARMARLAYCRNTQDFAFDQALITNALATIGFTPRRFFETQGTPNKGGTHCFVAVHDDPAKENKLAIVAFRGTDKDDPADLLDDAGAALQPWDAPGKVSTGFAKAFRDVQPGLLQELQSIDYTLIFTGHSLGAALAVLLASLRRPTSLYTFGCPRVGDPNFVAALAPVDSHRYVDCCDLVARVPPELLGYAHLGNPYYIAQDRTVSFNPDSAFVSSNQLRAREDYLVQCAWKIGNVGFRDLADHAPINYVWPLTPV